MKNHEERLDRLFKAARQAPSASEPAELPGHLETRILAEWRSSAEPRGGAFAPVLRWALMGAAAVMLVSIAWASFGAGKVERQKASKPLDTKEHSKEVARSFRERCHARLNLTPEQAKKIDGIIERYSTKILSVHDEKRTCVRQMCDERNSRILAVLTPQQQEAFEQMAKERKE